MPLSRPLLFAALLVGAWAFRLLLLPWQRALDPLTAQLVDQALSALVLAGLPMLWWLTVDPVGWRDVLNPLRGGGTIAQGAAILGAVAYALAFRLSAVADGQPWVAVPPGAGAVSIFLVAVGATARAAVEEALFRGYLLGRLRTGGLAFLTANMIQAAAFTALHAPGWLIVSGLAPAQAVALLATTAVFAFVAGVLVRLRGGIGLAIVLHAAVNIASGAGWSGAWSRVL